MQIQKTAHSKAVACNVCLACIKITGFCDTIPKPTAQKTDMRTARKMHPRATEGISQQVDGGDRRPKEVVREEDEHPVLDYARYVHCEGAGLAYEHEDGLCMHTPELNNLSAHPWMANDVCRHPLHALLAKHVRGACCCVATCSY